MKNYYLHTTSLSCKNPETLDDALSRATETSYERLAHFCPELPDWEAGMGYADNQYEDRNNQYEDRNNQYEDRNDCHLSGAKYDENVSFYESHWNGIKCFIISFYGIDNIFVEETDVFILPEYLRDEPWQNHAQVYYGNRVTN